MMPHLTRREFTKLALTTLPGIGLLSMTGRLSAAERPNSKFAGVQIGLNVPYSFGGRAMPGDEVLQNCLQLGVSGIELRTQPVEIFLGASEELVNPKKDGPKIPGATEKLREWRRSAPLDRVKEFRKKYETAGVLIEIVKVDGIFKMVDEEIDYMFALAKELGGRAISAEISHGETADADHERVGHFADKHKMFVGYHGHASTKPEDWEKAFSLAKFNGANVDLGHFVAGNNTSPVPFLKQHHERVTHVHLKDRKFNEGPNTPFGEGDTPIVEVLRLMRDSQWPFQGTIEFEYKVPEGSDRMKEIARCIKYCKDALA